MSILLNKIPIYTYLIVTASLGQGTNPTWRVRFVSQMKLEGLSISRRFTTDILVRVRRTQKSTCGDNAEDNRLHHLLRRCSHLCTMYLPAIPLPQWHIYRLKLNKRTSRALLMLSAYRLMTRLGIWIYNLCKNLVNLITGIVENLRCTIFRGRKADSCSQSDTKNQIGPL